MNSSRITFLLIPFAIVLACAPTAEAAHGVADLSWNTCAPVVSAVSATPGMGPLSLFVSELGNDQTHNAYEVTFQLGAMDNTVPDAWRFDAAGCQGLGLLVINHVPPAAVAKTCPPFQGPVSGLQIRKYEFMPPGFGLPTTLVRGLLASTYPVQTANPAQRYFLAEFRFDHTFSVNGPGTPGVTCGGLETPIIVRLLFGEPGTNPSGYLRYEDQLEFSFEPGNTVVTVNGAVPATPTTWGLIKSAYHN